jgi:hypothetical protein
VPLPDFTIGSGLPLLAGSMFFGAGPGASVGQPTRNGYQADCGCVAPSDKEKEPASGVLQRALLRHDKLPCWGANGPLSLEL